MIDVRATNKNLLARLMVWKKHGAIGILLMLGISEQATLYAQRQQLFSFQGHADERFGSAVAVDGDLTVVGAPGHSSGGINAGAVYVFRYAAGQGWVEEIQLIGDDTKAGDLFGTAVAIDGRRVLVGAPGADPTQSGAGAAYVFVQDLQGRWTQEATLIADDGALRDGFGEAVALDGLFAIVGAPGEDTGGAEAGAAYVFSFIGPQGWRQLARLKADIPQADAAFGQALALHGDDLIIGAPRADEPRGANAGLAYYFHRSGSQWTQFAFLTAGDAAFEDAFGTAVAIRPDVIVVGTPGDDARGGTNAGAAYVFVQENERWEQQAKLTAADAAAGATYGQSVAMSEAFVVVGAPNDSGTAFQGGTSYAYAESTPDLWQEVTRRNPDYLRVNEAFGHSIALSDQFAVIGAPSNDQQAIDAGVAYVYAIDTYITSTEQHESHQGTPVSIALYPNPFMHQTAIDITLPFASSIRLVVYDVLGRIVDVVADGMLLPGSHQFEWAPAYPASGTYWIELQTPSQRRVQSVLYIPR